jgi:tetratricopeptide (TPR) repeat protein
MAKTGKIGRYGIDWGESRNDLTEKDYETILVETTKIIEDENYPDKKERSTAFYSRGIIHTRNNDYQKAIDDYTSSIKIDNNIESYYNRARLYYLVGDLTRALKGLKYFIKKEPNEYDAKGFIEAIEKELLL